MVKSIWQKYLSNAVKGLSAVLQNHEILDLNYNLSQLLFLEAYYIKKHDPVINHGLKASKELLLFDWYKF